MPVLQTAAATRYPTSGNDVRPGQLKITQLRGVAGLKQNQRDTLRTLGTKEINDVVYKDNRPEIRGMVRTDSHLVGAEQINIIVVPADDRVGGVVKNEITMIPNNDGLSGSIYELADDEYLQVESGPDGGVVVWSSDLDVVATLSHFRETLGEPSKARDGYLISGDRASELSSSDAEDQAMHRPEDVHLVVAVHGDAQISWREPQRKLVESRLPYVELCYSAPVIEWATVLDLVDQTASDHVKGAIQALQQPIVRSLGRNAIA